MIGQIRPDDGMPGVLTFELVHKYFSFSCHRDSSTRNSPFFTMSGKLSTLQMRISVGVEKAYTSIAARAEIFQDKYITK